MLFTTCHCNDQQQNITVHILLHRVFEKLTINIKAYDIDIVMYVENVILQGLRIRET